MLYPAELPGLLKINYLQTLRFLGVVNLTHVTH